MRGKNEKNSANVHPNGHENGFSWKYISQHVFRMCFSAIITRNVWFLSESRAQVSCFYSRIWDYLIPLAKECAPIVVFLSLLNGIGDNYVWHCRGWLFMWHFPAKWQLFGKRTFQFQFKIFYLNIIITVHIFLDLKHNWFNTSGK